jgi:hypothetical protein
MALSATTLQAQECVYVLTQTELLVLHGETLETIDSFDLGGALDPVAMKVAPDNSRVYVVGTKAGDPYLLSTPAGDVGSDSEREALPLTATEIVITPDSRTAYLLAGNRVVAVDLPSANPVATIELPGTDKGDSMAIDPAGDFVMVAGLRKSR